VDRDVQLYVAVASARDWKCQFGSSMTSLAWHLGTRQLEGRLAALEVKIAAQAALCEAREQAVIEALNRGFTHLFTVDDDMVFPADVIERLLAHDKDFVCANYPKKDPTKSIPVCMGLDDQFIHPEGRSGIEEIGWGCMGMTLLRLSAIKDLQCPYFCFMWNEPKQASWTEDYVFSHRLRQHGVKLWVDHDLSRCIGHVGDVEYRFPAREVA
jgi:hypothetical protein